MFKTRLLSGIILIAISLAVILTGGYVLYGVMIGLSLLGMFELYRVFGVEKTELGVCGYWFCLAYYISLLVGKVEFVWIALVFLATLLAFLVFTYPTYHINQVTGVFFGWFYVAVMLSYIYQLRVIHKGIFLVWLIFIGAWGCDTCAYCVGMLFGKRKLAPVLSPKKSVEGALGGVLGAALLGCVYALVANVCWQADLQVLWVTLACGVAGVVSQVGDLAASAIKRNYGIKDYGKLIPGHGGILDRFDSIIIVAPIIYHFASRL